MPMREESDPRQLAEQPTLDEPARTAAPTDPSAPGDPPVSVPPGMPERVGEFRIIGELGRGGMGVVYLAEQSHPRRTVALKVINAALLSERSLRRFEDEVRVLGMLHHPGIAAIYQAGRAELHGAEAPYFAMEVVRGEPLTSYAARRGLSVRERLALLAEVAHAVHHAHTKGVVHRDLKPANVLVDDRGRPRVLDFGIARATDPTGEDRRDRLTMTEPGQLVGTLAYMSPEQAAGDAEAVDTRSDVYALGVIAYELLSGVLPHDVSTLSLADSLRTITSGEVAQLGSVEPALRGDVATIVGKALEKDRGRRYQSAEELAADIERHLADQPIQARPPSTAYLLSKFARRNRALVAGAGAVAAALVLGIVGTTYQAIAATRAQRVAEEQRRTAAEINAFLLRMLQSADPTEAQGEEVTVREMIDVAARELDDAEAAELPPAGLPPAELGSTGRSMPEGVEAELRYTLGQLYLNLGELASAERMLGGALEMYERLDGPGAQTTHNVRRQIGVLLMEQGRFDEAEANARDAVEGLARIAGPDHKDTIGARLQLARAVLEQGRLAEGVERYEAAAADARRALGEGSDEHIGARLNLSSAYQQAGDLPRSAEVGREVLALLRRELGDRHPDTLSMINNLAATLSRLGEQDESLALMEEAMQTRRQVLGPEHRATLNASLNYAGVLAQLGDLDTAEPIVDHALAVARRKFGPANTLTQTAINHRAFIHDERGEYDRAEALYREAIELREASAGRDHPEMLAPINNLGMLLVRAGEPAEAEPVFRDLLERTVAITGPEHFFVGIFRSNYGLCLTTLGRHDDARRELAEAVRLLEAGLGPDRPRTLTARDRLAEARAAGGDPG